MEDDAVGHVGAPFRKRGAHALGSNFQCGITYKHVDVDVVLVFSTIYALQRAFGHHGVDLNAESAAAEALALDERGAHATEEVDHSVAALRKTCQNLVRDLRDKVAPIVSNVRSGLIAWAEQPQ